MKSTLFMLLFCSFLGACSNDQSTTNIIPEISTAETKITYQEWKMEAKSDMRLFPKFGNAVKSSGQIKADQELINTYTKQQGSRRKGSEVLVKLGVDHLYKGDPRTAIYRFNQAWLLDPKNENVFWGFASIYFEFGDLEDSMKQLNEGLALNPKSSSILTDMGVIHIAFFQSNNDKKELTTAIDLLSQSYIIDPKNQFTLFKLSEVYLMDGDCDHALKYFNECKALGGRSIEPEYFQEIKKKCGK